MPLAFSRFHRLPFIFRRSASHSFHKFERLSIKLGGGTWTLASFFRTLATKCKDSYHFHNLEIRKAAVYSLFIYFDYEALKLKLPMKPCIFLFLRRGAEGGRCKENILHGEKVNFTVRYNEVLEGTGEVLSKIFLENVKIESGWKEVLKEEFVKEYFALLKDRLISAKRAGAVVYPPGNLIFNAFNLTPFDEVKAVILGQDPYHGAGQAMGLSFSVPRGVKVPPSLLNIYREIYDDLGIREPLSGDLTYWAKQGVLLLNASLTVEAGKANSHKDFGWAAFTDAVIRALSEKKSGVVFLLWGAFARGKSNLIDGKKHLVLQAAHPSPLAGGRFSGCRHFSKTNAFLKSVNKAEIDWDLNHFP